jgi:L-rhamnose isomerase
MAKMCVKVPHNLETSEAISRLQGLTIRMRKDAGDKIQSWEESWGDTQGSIRLTAMNTTVQASVVVTKDQVELSADLPWTLTLLKGKIESEVTQGLKDALR